MATADFKSLLTMSLDLSKPNKMRSDGEKTAAECPDCAAKDQDSRGDYLVIYRMVVMEMS